MTVFTPVKWASGLGVMTLPLQGFLQGEDNDFCIYIKQKQVDEYLLKRELCGLTHNHLKLIKTFLSKFLKYNNYRINQETTLQYLKLLKEQSSISYYRKQLYQILKFLMYLGIEWAKDIKPPMEPEYQSKRITQDDIHQTLQYFCSHQYSKQFTAIIFLGATSGLRAEELYQLLPEDIDLENRTIYVRHNPNNGQTTKTKKSRVSFVTKETKKALKEYLDFFTDYVYLTKLFSKAHIERAFRQSPIKVKDLRKFFSQEWDRQGGPTTIKKILMGHSLRGDVDLMHYNYQSEEDLKKIYDKVGIKIS